MTSPNIEDEAVIRPVTEDGQLQESVAVIQAAFQTVADELCLTEANCPTNPAFLKLASLEALRQKGVQFYGLFSAARLAGFVAIEKSSDTLYFMEKLAVLPEFRHRGYGRRLLDFVFAAVRQAGGAKVSIAIVDENTRLKYWYQAYGFRETRCQKFAHLPFTVCFLEKEVG